MARIGVTHVAVGGVVAYMAYTFWVLYRIALPPLPPLVDAVTGAAVPSLTPLWAARPLEFEVVLSPAARRRGGGGVPEVTLLRLAAVPRWNGSAAAWLPAPLAYDWTTAAMTAHLVVHVLRAPSPPVCAADAPAAAGVACGAVEGLAVACATTTNDDDANALCATLADAAAVAVAVAAAPAAPAAAGERTLAVWRDDAGIRLARLLVQGAPLYAHATVSVPKGRRTRNDGGARSDGGARNDGGAEDWVVAATAPVVLPATYRPPPPLRYLWRDPWGAAAAADAAAVAAFATLPVDAASKSLLGAARGSGGYNRAFLNTTSPPHAPREVHYTPAAGRAWPHWVGDLAVKLIMETATLPRHDAGLPRAMAPYVREDSRGGHYVPLLAINPVRPASDAMAPLNTTLARLPLRVTLAPVSIGAWQLLQVLDHGIATQHALGATERDTDDVVRMFADTPLWLLATTLVVSCVHLLFDALALKNDISFWSATTSLKGISLRSLAIQLVSDAIVLAYLWSEDSSLLVLLPQAAFTALLVLKIAKGAGIVWRRSRWLLPLPAYDAALAATAADGGTTAADTTAVVYLAALLGPVLAGFTVYCFLYYRYRGWADWALSTAVSMVYTFGFLMMTPQLVVNYKLKSVAHMPWRVLGYRFFNTIIDDLFASVIRMPLMHRVSVFRDDVIFLIFMAQRWKYPVDASRPAEGFDIDESTAAAQRHAAAVAAASGAGDPPPPALQAELKR